MPWIRGIEKARGMIHEGMAEVQDTKYGTSMHPLGALAMVTNVLVMPRSLSRESLDKAHILLHVRLRQSGVLETETEHKELFFSHGPIDLRETRENAWLWRPAMEIIREPITRREIDEQFAVEI